MRNDRHSLSVSLFIASLLLAHTVWAVCVDPPSDMIAWWPLDETSGTAATELVRGSNGNIAGGALHGPGKVQGGLQLDGIDDHVSAVEVGLHGAPDSLVITIDAWIKPDVIVTDLGDYQWLVRYDVGSTWVYGMAIHGGELTFTANYCTPTSFNIRSGSLLTAGAWTHVAVVASSVSETVVFYVNGAPIHTAPGFVVGACPGLPASTGTFYIGDPDGNSFDGAIDEVEIFDRALTGPEMQSIHDAGASGKCKYENVPTLSEWALITLTILLVAAGLLYTRRREALL